MTTPERLRRRQRVEFAGLICLGLLVVFSTFTSDRRDDAQDVRFKECIVEVVSGIARNSDARAELNKRDTNSTTAVILRVARAGGDGQKISAALADFETEQTEIAADRKRNGVPPFPDGKCED